MAKIRILPEVLSNKIAAGEVVERPCSVLKELLENALDADAKKIVVDVENGGRSLIRVADDGCGMGHDDALLSLERYATSKIFSDDDLFSISTLGFRGEALPSIASVSRLTLITREAASDTATKIQVAGGKIQNVLETGAPRGTLIEVRDLFFNVPARRKFLKSAATEMAHISDTVAAMAMAWPQVSFSLSHNGRSQEVWPAVRSQADRVHAVLGQDTAGAFLEITVSGPGLEIHGWMGPPEAARSSTRALYLFVNGRLVKDQVATHAVMEGYRGRLMKGQYPAAVLFITVPPDEVDVNVHPAKAQVRFAKPGPIHDALARAVSQRLTSLDRALWDSSPPPRDSAPAARETSWTAREKYRPDLPGRVAPLAVYERPQEPVFVQDKGPRSFSCIGQVFGTYLLCESALGLVIVDQHAAHERILYEKFQAMARQGSVPVQNLLVPETFEMSHEDAGILEALIPEMEKAGLIVERFSGRTFVVKAVPALLSGRPMQGLVRELVDKAALASRSRSLEEAMEQNLKSMACHGAIRANQILSKEEMEALVRDLAQCEHPGQCPHGRPTWIAWTKAELEKDFKRL